MPTVHYGVKNKSLLERIDSSDQMSEENRETLQEFFRFLDLNDYSAARKNKYLNTLIKVAENIDFDFTAATKSDIEDFILWLKERDDITDRTRYDYKSLMKRFYRWIGEGEYPDCIAWLKPTDKSRNGKLPEEMLEEKDIIKLIAAATNSRDRALIMLLWETGARMGEIIDLRTKNFEEHKHGLKIVVNGKTGQRRIPLIDSVPYINAWLENHPHRSKKDAPMWVNEGTRNNGQQMEYPAIRKMLNKTAKQAKIQKPVHPHHFRHSRATYMANRFTEAQLCQWFGWVQGSRVPARYVHLSGRDIDAEYARLHGIEDEEKPKTSKLTPTPCPRCSNKVPPDATYCYKCGMALSLEAALDAEKYAKIGSEIQKETMNAALSGEKIDLDLLAELVANKLMAA